MKALALFITASAPLALGLYTLLPTAADARQDHVITAPLPTGPHPAPLAVNVPELHYWAAQQVYSNLFTQASRWHREDLSTWAWDSGPPLAQDEHGWVTELLPNQAASVLIARGPNGLLAAGAYELRWDGTGAFQVQGDSVVVATEPNRMELAIATPSTSGVQLRLIATDPTDPVRNIRLFPPGIDPDDHGLFHPRFLQLLSEFRAIRFMDWQRTNGSEVREWSDRSLPTAAVQTGDSGVCLEHMLALCNELDCDAWFCIPHLASDDYVENFATQVKEQLEPERRVFIEFSNEVWNGGFTQAQYANQQGALLGLSGSAFQNQLRWYSQRAVEIFGVWNGVFAQDSARLVRVLAGQSVNPWTGQVILDHDDAYQQADVYAVAPYFGATMGSPENAAGVLQLSGEAFWKALDDSVTFTLEKVVENVTLADSKGLPLLAYEAGQHLAGIGPWQNDQALTDLFMGANRSDRMGALYTRFLEGWRNSGAHEMFLWNLADEPSKFGSWGLVERSNQNPAEAPKLRAVRLFSSQNSPWW